MFDSMVLNEASLPFNSSDACVNNLNSFFEILHLSKLKNVKFSRADNIEGNWSSLSYAADFNFGQWLNHISDRDKYRQIQSVLSTVKCPLVCIDNNLEQKSDCDALFLLSTDNNIEVLGLGVAYLNKAYGLSFASQEHWEKDSITITKQWDEAGLVIEKNIDVPNICTIKQVEFFLVALEAEKQSNRNYFSKITPENNSDFPNLLFTNSVLKTFRSPSLSALDYRKALEALNKLNAAIVTSNNLDELALHAELRVSGESTETMTNRKLKRLRTFIHPTLGSTVFEDHVKNFPDSKRMHIFINYEENKVCIGYFGRHLKTISE